MAGSDPQHRLALLSTLGMVTFIPALQLTSVSNVAIMMATGPFVAAALAWLWLGEAARWQTCWRARWLSAASP